MRRATRPVEGVYRPKAIPGLSLWKRALYALPSVFVFLCYTMTAYPILRYIIAPSMRMSRGLGWFMVAGYVTTLVWVLFCWLRLALGVVEAGGVPEEWLKRAAQGLFSFLFFGCFLLLWLSFSSFDLFSRACFECRGGVQTRHEFLLQMRHASTFASKTLQPVW
jgi:hypothetical protein